MNVPTAEIASRLNLWENEPKLVPYIRPLGGIEDLGKINEVTVETLARRLETQEEYLIYDNDQLIGEASVRTDPEHLAKKESKTAWLGIYIGDERSRGSGAGTIVLTRLEDTLKKRGFRRIELGVFEFNIGAYRFYSKLGFREFAKIEAFTWFRGKMWRDLRMEKYL
jgi:RimJ/RimL family protein N-acetyltransferase